MRFPLLGRFLVVAGVALALLLPLSLIRDKVSERGDRADAVQKAFADQTSGAHAIAGPLLAVTCEETYVDERVVHRLHAPLGSRNDVRIGSDWRHPSFVGAYSPDEREIGPDGFSARWRVNELSTGGNAFWLESAAAGELFTGARLLGVALVMLLTRKLDWAALSGRLRQPLADPA